MKALLPALGLALSSCATIHQTVRAPGPPYSTKHTHYPREAIVVRCAADWPQGVGTVTTSRGRTIIDGGRQWTISGAQMPGECDQNERNEPVIRIQMPNLTLRGFGIAESKDGITSNRYGTIFEDLVVTKICEDGINPMAGCNGSAIRNCYLSGACDKSIQWNGCKKIEIRANTIVGGINAIRLMGTSSDAVTDNEIYNVRTGIQVTKGGILRVRPGANKFYGTLQDYKTEEGGIIEGR